MFVFVILLSFYMLFSNLKGYKTVFVPNKYLNSEFKEKMKSDEGSDGLTKDEKTGLMYVLIILMACLSITFYVVAANVFISQKLLLLYAVLQIVLTIVGVGRFISFMSQDRELKNTFLSRIRIPLNTVFIGYFIYYYIMNI
jgi:hypothetical protein